MLPSSNFEQATTPCKGYPDRSAECHASCLRYAAYADQRAKIRKARKEESELSATGYSLYLKRHGRYMKRKNTK